MNAYSFISLSMFTHCKILQILLCNSFFQKSSYFLMYYYNTIIVVYKINITIYSMYTYMLDINTILDSLV
jgi:hypothetical protein